MNRSICKKNILSKIENKFQDHTKNTIAKQCLDIAMGWVVCYNDLDGKVKIKRKYLDNLNSCHQYIIDKFDKSQVKSSALLAIILPIVISYVAKWVAQWVTDNLLDD